MVNRICGKERTTEQKGSALTGIIGTAMVMLALTAALTVFAMARIANHDRSALGAVTETAQNPGNLVSSYEQGVAELRSMNTETTPAPKFVLTSMALTAGGFIGLLLFSLKHHRDMQRHAERVANREEPLDHRRISRATRRRERKARAREQQEALQAATRVSRVGKNLSLVLMIGGCAIGIFFLLAERI